MLLRGRKYWWVNQAQTHQHELAGGYLWSPQRRKNGTYNQFYENMKLVAPGDVVFSYWGTKIRARGDIRSFGYDLPKPDFGNVGRNWSDIGYRVDVEYVRLDVPVEPRRHWSLIQPLLPSKYSPLEASSGKGLQSVYLASVPDALGLIIERLIGDANPLQLRDVGYTRHLLAGSLEEPERERWEQHQVERIRDAHPVETECVDLIKARRGQGVFRERVARVEAECRVTKVSNPAYLIASHIKPWRHANDDERLSDQNGLMLAPHVDFLFDRGFISFSDGKTLIAEVTDVEVLRKLKIDPDRPPEVGGFTRKQEEFLEYHRRSIFKSARGVR